MKSHLGLLLVCAVLPGCFRTIYRNVLPPNSPTPVESDKTLVKKMPRGWQHFFAYGLIPNEITVDAAELCEGEEHVKSVETQRTFLKGLVSAYGIYTPWNAHVTCDHPAPP